MLIDNPAGTGYSYAKREVDLVHNDYSFSLDAINFMEQFFKDWPELTKNPLFVAGSGFAGIFAPYMTW